MPLSAPLSAPLSLRRAVLGALAIAAIVPALAQHKLGPQGSFDAPKIAAASDEGEKNLKRFQLPPGWKGELWAAEPQVAHPVAFDIADDGRVFVSETFRAWRGVPDIRGIMDWLDEDLASTSVEDRLAEMKRHLGDEGMKDYYKNTERVRLLTDPTGTGKATRSQVFAENFATPLDGVASGVLARGNEVWFANIPNIWRLRDADGDGAADFRQSISYGHGIRVGFLGHDLHGLTWGPDGKLYFSIGDRASVLKTEGRVVGTPDSGAVFRCNPDGSEMQMLYKGLRNPQQLVFDEWGDLFTGDNNSDGGDQARWTYLIEGGDSGWRIGWQFLEQPNPRGPWNSEKMWYPQNETQPAFITPPIKNISAGPSGVSYYPGTGLGPEWQGTYTLCDFRGSGAGSGVWSFKHKPKGASFEIVEDKKMVWAIEATDAKWGPDGAFWITDWVDGWEGVGKGRIYRFHDPATLGQPIVKATQALLKAGFAKRPEKELLKLLAHPNQRVRQGAQFELAARGDKSVPALVKLTKAGNQVHARLHAVWALGQVQGHANKARREASSVELDALVPLLSDADAHVRGNAARVLGDAGYAKAFDVLVKGTTDSDAHARALATIALGKLGKRESVPALFASLKANADRDPHLRHAAVTALVAVDDFDALQAAIKDPDASVRMGVLLAMRRLQRNEIGAFLADADDKIVVEAARAINDEPISGAMDLLAVRIEGPVLTGKALAQNVPFLRRAVNANYRHGTQQTAARLAKVATDAVFPDDVRAEALDALAEWPKNSGRDRITGLWRPTAFARDAKIPGAAARPVVDALLADAPEKVRTAAARAAGELKITSASGPLAKLVTQKLGNAASRVAALTALSRLQTPDYPVALEAAQKDPEEAVRKAALKLSVDAPPAVASGAAASPSTGSGPLAKLIDVIALGSLAEKQNAYAALAKLPGVQADEFIGQRMTDLVAGKVPADLQLDVLDAAAARPALKAAVAGWEAALPKTAESDVNPWKVCLTGGNAEEGKKVFLEKVEVSCVRCHKINAEGGEVGPELTGLGDKKGREYLLQSLLYPNASIAQGFESVLVTLKNGTTYAGVIKSETDAELEINSPEDGLLKLKKAEITAREKGLSGMPDGFGGVLTKQEIRNLVEFITTSK